ncbi:uncharacterized protein V6R79_016682 [Siganus canaliculatus]
MPETDQMRAGQTIPQACQVSAEQDQVIPPRVAGVAIRLVVLKGQRPTRSQAFFQPLPQFHRLKLMVCGNPMLEINNRSTSVLVQNPTHTPIQIRARRMASSQSDPATASVMTSLQEILGVEVKFHISHHPQSSGQVERTNQTVIHMLKKYVSGNGKDWDIKLPLVLMAIRATPHRTTGVTPFEMMTGREMTLPLHLLFHPEDVSVATAYTAHQYVSDLRKHLQAMFGWAQENLEASVEGAKTYYDRKASHREYQIGDRVFYFRYNNPVGISKKFLPSWSGPFDIVVSLSTLQRRMKELDEEMPEIQQQRLSQQEQLHDIGKTLQGTVVTVNLHSTLLNHTLHSLQTLSEVVEEDITYVRAVRDLMQDLVREVTASVSSLSTGRIPAYLVPLTIVEGILKAATTTEVSTPQIHLAYSLGSAIPISVNPQELELGFILNLPLVQQQHIYRLKTVLNVICYARLNAWVPVLRILMVPEQDIRPSFRLTKVATLKQERDHGWGQSLEVLIFVYWLAHGTSYGVTAEAFDIPNSTIHRIAREIRKARSKMTIFPSCDTLDEVVWWFGVLAQHGAFNKAVGATDGCHIRIKPPKQNKPDYFNYKQFYSIRLQAICDSFVGYGGSVHDTRILRNSPIYVQALYPPPGSFLLGDGGYLCLIIIIIITPDRHPLQGSTVQAWTSLVVYAAEEFEFGQARPRTPD